MKIIRLFLVVLCLCLGFSTGVQAKKIKPLKVTTVKYTLPTAREEAFKKVPSSLPLSYYKADLTDKQYNSNMHYIKHSKLPEKNEISRNIYPLYCCDTLISYGIRYENRLNKVYYYNSSGKLLRIEFDDNNPQTYPKRITTYNNKGKLHTVVFYVSEKEQFNFDGNKNLIVHWVGEKAYNKDGKLMKIRRSL